MFQPFLLGVLLLFSFYSYEGQNVSVSGQPACADQTMAQQKADGENDYPPPPPPPPPKN